MFFFIFKENHEITFCIIFNMNKFFVIGERFFCTSFSETTSGKRGTYFEPGASRDLNLERHQTLRKRMNLTRGSRLVVVDGAPSTGGAKHSLSTFSQFLQILARSSKI